MKLPVYRTSNELMEIAFYGYDGSYLYVRYNIAVKVTSSNFDFVSFRVGTDNTVGELMKVYLDASGVAELNIHDAVVYQLAQDPTTEAVKLYISGNIGPTYTKELVPSDLLLEGTRTILSGNGNLLLPPSVVLMSYMYSGLPVVCVAGLTSVDGDVEEVGYYGYRLLPTNNVVAWKRFSEVATTTKIVNLPCGVVCAWLRYADPMRPSCSRVELWKVVDIKTSTGESVSIASVTMPYDVRKAGELEVTLSIDGLDAYSVAYYSEIINAESVQLSFDAVPSSEMQVVNIITKSVALPTGGNNNKIEIKAIIHTLPL